MMKIYRPLQPIKAITFDLDDTLYDNVPVMRQTEEQVLLFLQQTYPTLSDMTVEDFKQVRMALREAEPDIYHDVSQWRWRSIEHILRHHHYSEEHAKQGATDAMAIFAQWRSCVEVPQSTYDTLNNLSQHFILAAITNGNAEPERFGLSHYFNFILRAGPDGRAKPFEDMFIEASQRLNLPISQILHVGDHLLTDVAGAVNAGAQACWINDQNRNLMTAKSARVLPHIEISQLESLQALI